MHDTLQARLLDESMIGPAYTLVQNSVPNVSPARWRDFAAPQIDSRRPDWPSGIMSAQNSAGCILGLYRFEVRDILHISRTFCADNIIVASFPGRERIWEVLAKTMDDMARVNGCRMIRAELSTELGQPGHETAWLMAMCRECGFALDGLRGFKLVMLPASATKAGAL